MPHFISRFILALALPALFLPLFANAQLTEPARYMSLTSHEVNMRIGPSTEFPRLWVYQRRNLPFLVIDEVAAGWVRLRAHDGEEGWVSRDLLTTRRTFRIQSFRAEVYRRPSESSRVTAYLGEGVVGSLRACEVDWCQVEHEDLRGWVHRQHIWGVDNDEIF